MIDPDGDGLNYFELQLAPSGETFESDNSPMEFAEPGERGFLSDQPLYDCGDMMS